MLHAARYLVKGNTEAPFFQSGYTNWKVAKYLHDAGLRARGARRVSGMDATAHIGRGWLAFA